MSYEENDLDELLSGEDGLLEESASQAVPEPEEAPDVPAEMPQEAPKKKKKKKSKMRSFWRGLLTFFGRLFLFLLETVLLLAVALYGVMFVIVKGPSPAARDLFVRSVKETSAGGFLANIYLTDAEIEAIISANADEPADYEETDTSLIVIPQPTDPSSEGGEDIGPQPDAWGLVDEDGDGIIIEEVKGEGFSGKMMVVLDPSRVIMGSFPDKYGIQGYTVASMAEKYDAVACINAGGFDDPGGNGNGSIPNALVVYEGEVYYAAKGVIDGFVGIDSNHILHVANKITTDQIKEKNIQYGVCFGPVLVSNGEICSFDHLISGVNPRTAIGQRSDGAMLLLVVEGRMISSLGATYADLAEVFLSYGAVNACNLDGGSSSLMYYNGEYITTSASMVGIRAVPTTFVVLKEGVSDNG